MRSAFRTAMVTLAAFAVTSCVNSSGTDASEDAAVVDVPEIVNATSGAPGIAFSVDIASGTTVVLSTTGVLDVAELQGFRSDSAGLDGAGLEPLADVWLDSGQHYESVDGATAEPTHGDLASFMSINGAKDPASVHEVIDDWLGSTEPQQPTRETIDGIIATHFTLDRAGRTPLEIWVDSAQRLVRVVEVGDQIRPWTSTHVFEYPDSVAIPVRP